ncbi:MAG: membrane protein insertase YidC [Candidatus Methylopumilus sp.]|nr:membrane protein insertase YidC [Candidatus Methylopumilus sp.]
MDTKRLILFVVLSFSILLVWDSWQRKTAPVTDTTSQQDVSIPSSQKLNNTQDTKVITSESNFKLETGARIKVATDLYQIEIDTVGGDIRRLLLNNHLADNAQDKFLLLDDAQKPLLYVAQTGLIGNDLPTHKTIFTTDKTNYSLEHGQNNLDVKLNYKNQDVEVLKIISFERDSYQIQVRYEITNHGKVAITPSAYFQLVHDDESNQGSAVAPTFTGGAYYTDADKFQKIKFTEMKKHDLSLIALDGWAGVVQQYFASAWILPSNQKREFYTKQVADNIYSSGVLTQLPTIQPGEEKEFSTKLYSGPQIKEQLEKAAPGLVYTVDYGWLTFVASPLFVVLSWIQKVVNNWGGAIILLTVLIKILFYPLSASSYKSMAQLRELAPRLQSMKEKFGEDKVKFQQAMLELYRTEKINPMGGCLPILIQIPVFIALYWVLMGAVELRHAPFMLWITDLSVKDPYYILPIIMGISMIVQTKLNPAPTDPMQAKLMMIMPVVFSVFFFFFPAGLVLYWVINNLLSILQQWMINRSIHAATLAKKGNAPRT